MITERETRTITREVQDADWEQIAELVNRYEDDGVTDEILRDRSNRWVEGDPRLQLVTLDDGKLIAHARSLRRSCDPEGKFATIVYVHPDALGRGIGRELLAKVESHAVTNGAKFLITYIMEKSDRGNAFAEINGYVKNQRLFESKIDVPSFDPQPYLAKQSELEQQGYRFFTLEQAGHTEENARKLHDLDSKSDEDTPGIENWGIRTFDQYVRDEHDSYGFTPAGVFIAEFEGEWVAMSAIRPSPIEGHMHVDYTGVLREHRGKGLAHLLKAQTLVFAQSLGATELSTNNDERNGVMLRMNERFGFVAEPGFFVYRKELIDRDLREQE